MPSYLTRTPVMWTLVLLIHAVASSLPPPVNVSILSLNLEHKLTWRPGSDTPTWARFCVQSREDGTSWLNVSGCADLGWNESCDLTALPWDPYNNYVFRVQAFSPAPLSSSSWTHTQLFHPIADTVLGPPVLRVSGCGACLRLQISPPTTRGQHEMITYLYSHLKAEVTRTRDRAQFSVRVQAGETEIGYLEPEAEYCVTVVTVTTFNTHTVPSQPHCAYTSPKAVNTVLVFVCVLSALSLVVALLLCSSLLYSGLLFPVRKPLPQTLLFDPALTANRPEHKHTLTHTLCSRTQPAV